MVPQRLIWAFSLCASIEKKKISSGRGYTSPTSKLPPADQLPSMGHPNFKISSAVRGMSSLPESPLACCIPSSTKDTGSCHPPVGVGPGPKEIPAGAGLAGPVLDPRSVLLQGWSGQTVLPSDLPSGWTISLGAWPAGSSYSFSLAFSFIKAGQSSKKQESAAKAFAPSVLNRV